MSKTKRMMSFSNLLMEQNSR